MKLNTIKALGFGLMVAVGLTTAANAQIVVYDWVQGNAADDASVTGSGTLVLNGGNFVSLTFNDGSDGTWTGFIGDVTILGDGDALLSGVSAGPNSIGLKYPIGSGILTGTYVPLTWEGNGLLTAPNEQNVQDSVGLDGDWVAVPEPATVMSGMLLLLPFGASTLRILRKNRAA